MITTKKAMVIGTIRDLSLCSNCYAKQTDKNTEWNPINNAKRQKGKRLDIKQKISIIIRSITDSIFDVDYIH
ncbi:MAG: hypothetical protein ACJ71F_19450 [Nitrososphaeraceae archaeon]